MLTKTRQDEPRRSSVDQVSDGGDGVRVLIVDDDPALRALVQRCIAPAAAHIDHADDGESALAMLAAHPADIVILDLELPRMNGLEVLMRVRRESDMPVIVLSGRGDESDRVLGLDLGADDYIVKPFLPRELLSRVRAVTRRAVRVRESGPSRTVIVHGPITIDRTSRECFYDNKLVTLTAKEFDPAGASRRLPAPCDLARRAPGVGVGLVVAVAGPGHRHRARPPAAQPPRGRRRRSLLAANGPRTGLRLRSRVARRAASRGLSARTPSLGQLRRSLPD